MTSGGKKIRRECKFCVKLCRLRSKESIKDLPQALSCLDLFQILRNETLPTVMSTLPLHTLYSFLLS
jgi:hypothetical protein